ncbi:MAG: hypothetical protein E7386_01200 [Ruminococcaceae bacterium]|nr:hypothetical protein [Oscillospiraceae bacterium]
MRKNCLALLFIFVLVLMAGCGYDTIMADDPLSEYEVIAFVEKKIKDETGDDVTAEIVSKEKLRVPTAWLDGGINYQEVKGGSEYKLEIMNNEDKSVTATATYKDGYIIYDKKKYPDGIKKDPVFNTDYSRKKSENIVKNEFIKALDERFEDYRIYVDVGTDRGLDVFICSTDYEKVYDLLIKLKEIALRYKNKSYTTYSVYIYKDDKVFNETDFSKYTRCKVSYGGQSNGREMISQYTGRDVEAVSTCRSFDKEYFESNGVTNAKKTYENTDRSSYEYLVFWYDAEPNSFAGYNKPLLCVFGVKK